MGSVIGIVGAGSFGMAITKLASENNKVLLYSRRDDLVNKINQKQAYNGIVFPHNVKATTSLEKISEQCNLIIPIIASAHFRKVMKLLSPYLNPHHILIHGTKGFDLKDEDISAEKQLLLSDVKTMSQVILEETNVLRVGALTGPNLAKEILNGLPTATVIASEYDEVIERGRKALIGKAFFVYGSHDLKGAELAGALKNIIALASGMTAANNLGKNVQAILITLGLREMMMIAEALGANPKSLIGTAGIGDLVATATSDKSRNYSFGYRIGMGEKFQNVLDSLDEVAEGIRSLKVANQIINQYGLQAPITKMIYGMIYNGKDVKQSIAALMKFPFRMDIDM
ncbi:MAG: NAD(P)H-dependent glycerol-3-phosphate dehydrogenase [Saprospiraceae bacterium]